jgi:hypothetical protein
LRDSFFSGEGFGRGTALAVEERGTIRRFLRVSEGVIISFILNTNSWGSITEGSVFEFENRQRIVDTIDVFGVADIIFVTFQRNSEAVDSSLSALVV